MLRQAQKEEEEVTFEEVVEAQSQVVSGIKYYMKISATQGGDGGDSRIFESVVVVKPWLRSKQLLNFAPYIIFGKLKCRLKTSLSKL